MSKFIEILKLFASNLKSFKSLNPQEKKPIPKNQSRPVYQTMRNCAELISILKNGWNQNSEKDSKICWTPWRNMTTTIPEESTGKIFVTCSVNMVFTYGRTAIYQSGRSFDSPKNTQPGWHVQRPSILNNIPILTRPFNFKDRPLALVNQFRSLTVHFYKEPFTWDLTIS